MKRTLATFSLLAIALVFVFSFVGCGGGTVYKTGLITAVTGEARVHRGGGSMPAYSGLILRHGDKLYTEADSSATVALDGDKYALIEAESQVEFALYCNNEENVALILLERGAVYTEVDGPLTDGLTYGILTSDVMISGGRAAYRAVLTEARGDEPRKTLAQAINGSVSVTALNSDKECMTLLGGYECQIGCYAVQKGDEPFFVFKDAATDPYSLPDRYIELGEGGVFDAEGSIIPKPPSGDLSLKTMTVREANGAEVPLLPEFSDSIPGYVAEAHDPFSLTVTANHPKTRVQIQCYPSISVESLGNTAVVLFDTEDGTDIFAVYILVTAENGEQNSFSVMIVPKGSGNA